MKYESFPNYTDAMYAGEEPCRKKPDFLNGGYRDVWTTQYGVGESYEGRLLSARFHLNAKISVCIIGSVLWITDYRYSGKTDVWEYTSDPDRIRTILVHPSRIHTLESDRIEKILNTDIDCTFWHMVQSRAKEIYGGEDCA